MRKKFKIMYPADHYETEKCGKPFLPGAKSMVIMNTQGVFFIYQGDEYHSSIKRLSDVLSKYDVVWK